MKIVITTQGKDLESPVDARFGRAKGFIVYDEESSDYSYIDNDQNLQAMQGAGIQSAKTVIDQGAGVVITGNVGPKAFETLNSANVKILTGASGTVKDALDAYRNGKLHNAMDANVEGHW